MRALERSIRALAAAPDADGALRAVASALNEGCGSDLAVIVAAASADWPLGLAVVEGAEGPRDVQPLLKAAVEPAPPTPEAVQRAAGLAGGTAIVQPLGGETQGYLAVLWRGPGGLGSESALRPILSAMSDQVSLALWRSRAAGAIDRAHEETRALIDALPVAACVVDTSLAIRYASAAWKAGAYGRAAAPGSLLDAVPRSEHARWRQLLQGLLAAARGSPEEAARVEQFAVDADGRSETHELCARLVRDAAGRPLAIALTATDVTRLRAASDRIRMRDQILDYVREAVIVVDLDGLVTFWNAWAQTLLGWSAQEMLGSPLSRLFPRGELGGALGAANAGSVRDEAPCLRRDGSTIWVEMHLTPSGTKSGEIAGVIVVARDVTRERALRAQLLQTERLASIGKMAAGVFHEIKNPATFVHTNLSIIRDQIRSFERLLREYRSVAVAHAPAHAVEALRDLEGSMDLLGLEQGLSEAVSDALVGSDQVRHIVRELGIFSRRSDRPAAAVDPNSVVESALTVASVELRRAATVKKNLGVVPAVSGDASQLAQVVLNLLVNAAHAVGAEGPATNRIEVTTRSEGVDREWVEIEVSDNGPGIAAQDLARIFEPFFTTKPAGEGTGLGLSICREIVEHHKGRIEVHSRPGEGARFVVRLPAVQAESPAP